MADMTKEDRAEILALAAKVEGPLALSQGDLFEIARALRAYAAQGEAVAVAWQWAGYSIAEGQRTSWYLVGYGDQAAWEDQAAKHPESCYVVKRPLFLASPPPARSYEEGVKRLKDAIEGECDGLAISDATARAILDYVATGEEPAS